jgi:hypothetical protein
MTSSGPEPAAPSRTEARRDRLLLDPQTRVTCPHCEREFGLDEAFAKRALEALVEAGERLLAGERVSVEAAMGARLEREVAEREQRAQGDLAALRRLIAERDAQHAAAMAEMRSLEQAAAGARLKGLQDMLAEKAGQVAALQAQELDLRRERVQLEEARAALEIEAQRRLDAQRHEVEQRARAAEAERGRLREAELQKTIDDMRGKLEEAQRKSAQGSQQLQGEVLELLLEEQLVQAFPLDSIVEVKKGQRGGDVVHTVMSRSGQPAGEILWEAKRAQRWSNGWPGKLRDDMRAAGAECGVIVTTSFPVDWPAGTPFGLHEDVWVSAPAAAVPLAAALREGLLEAYKARLASANKGEKMEAVYDYLTSPQFAHKLRAAYEAFTRMRSELNSERAATQQRWNRREKQIQLATAQLLGIAGDLQGLAQQDLPQLELEAPVPEAGPEAADEGDGSGS